MPRKTRSAAVAPTSFPMGQGTQHVRTGMGMPLAEALRCLSCASPPNPTCLLSTRDVSELTARCCVSLVRPGAGNQTHRINKIRPFELGDEPLSPAQDWGLEPPRPMSPPPTQAAQRAKPRTLDLAKISLVQQSPFLKPLAHLRGVTVTIYK